VKIIHPGGGTAFVMLKKFSQKIIPKINFPKSNFFDYSLLIFALFFGLISISILRQPAIIEKDPFWPWLLLIFSGLIGGFGILRMNTWLPDGSDFPEEQVNGDPKRINQGWTCILIAGVLSIWVILSLWKDTSQWTGAFLPWIISIGLLVYSSFLFQAPRPGKNSSIVRKRLPQFDFPIPRWVEIAAFFAILILAVFLRLYRFDLIPAGIYVDETNGALDALAILEGNHVSPFTTGWYGTPNGYIYYMAGLIKLFGANYATLKAISLIPAILTVIAIFPLGRMMFGPIGGLSAMMFLAVSRWHLSMSRWGWNELVVPLFQIVATYFLLRGLRERRWKDFILGGVISGLMMYTYLSSRLAIATFALFCVYWLLIDPLGPIKSVKRNAPGLALFVLAFAITFAPLAVTHITDPFTFSNRVDEISIFRDTKQAGNLQPLWNNIVDHLRFFHQVGDHQGKHNLPHEPQTDPITGVLFVIGLGYGLFKFRDRRSGLLWFWLLFGLAGGIFSSNHESPQSYRTLTSLPAITLLAGDVVSRILRGGFRVFPDPGNQMSEKYKHLFFGYFGSAILVLCLVGSAVWESRLYFGEQAHSIEYQSGFNLTENMVAHEVLDALKSDTPIYLSPWFYDYSQVRYLSYGYIKETTGKNTLEERPYFLIRPEDMLPIPTVGRDVILLLNNDYEPIIDLIRNYYPNSKISVEKWADQIPLYIRIQVPKSDFAALQGLSYTATLSDGSVKTGSSISLTLPQGASEMTQIEWIGSIQIEHSGEYQFSGSDNMQLFIDDVEWTGNRDLCNGLHPIRIIQDLQSVQEEPELRWKLPDGKEGPVPDQNLFNISSFEQGLTGYYYQGSDWQGDVMCKKNTPFFMLSWPDQEPIKGSFSASYKGFLRITQPGMYKLIIEADDGARLSLDGVVLGESLIPDQPNSFEISIDLQSGDHPIQIDYFQNGGGNGLVFYWIPPDSPRTIVPINALIPEQIQ